MADMEINGTTGGCDSSAEEKGTHLGRHSEQCTLQLG